MRIIDMIESMHYETNELASFIRSNYARDFKNKEFSSLENGDIYNNFKSALENYANGPDGPYGEERFRLYQQVHDLLNTEPMSIIYSLYDSFLDTSEINIYLLKATHERKTVEDLENEFRCTHRIASGRRSNFVDGTRVAGMGIKIDGFERGGAYESSVHPITLPLNLSEVYLMLIALKQYCQRFKPYDVQRKIIERIANEIYFQLSPYAKNILNKRFDELGYDFSDNIPPTFTSDVEQYDRIVMLGKMGSTVSFEFNNEMVNGHINLRKSVHDVSIDIPNDGIPRVVVRLEDGTDTVVEIDKIMVDGK